MELPVDKTALRRMRKALRSWYRRTARDLPWRKTTDPWLILLAEVMLQQTRVSTVIPYYERFVERFPTPAAMAAASQDEVLSRWSGLGYYSRARNLQRAARALARRGGFPDTWDELRALPGVGEYTAAAVGSIAFGLPHAVLDGNVLRVLCRVLADQGDIGTLLTRRRLGRAAQLLLDPRAPGDFNQALMELGATVCTPRNPDCPECPWRDDCAARKLGNEKKLPLRKNRRKPERADLHLLLIVRNTRVLLYQRPVTERRLAGFWDLPSAAQLPEAKIGETLGNFQHGISYHDYLVKISRACVAKSPRGMHWKTLAETGRIPLSTMAGKAFRLAWPDVPESE